MNRKTFIEHSLMMGMGLPFLSSLFLQSCTKKGIGFPQFQTDFSGKVMVVGAGAAGMAAAYLLKRYGVDFQIVEAAPRIGGRLMKLDGFADFPIDLGAEWIHTHPRVLADILNKPNANAEVDIIVYNPQSIQTWNNGSLHSHNYVSHFYSEWKFKNSTWFGFFEQFILPEIEEHLVLNAPITQIQYGGEGVTLQTEANQSFHADKVLLTTPLTILQKGLIGFEPALPVEKTRAIDKVFMGDGIKIFVEFTEKFYPDMLAFGPIMQAFEEEEKFVYDAAFRKDTNRHVLGLFAINQKAAAYTQLGSDEAIITAFLAELDEIFGGRASQTYIKHVIQNWSNEPFIQGAYSYAFDGNQNDLIEAISEPLNDKLYFAGEALSIDHQAMVQGACESAYTTVVRMLTTS